MEKSYLVMKENNLIDEVVIDKWQNEMNALQDQRKELSEKILLVSKRIQEEKNQILKQEEDIIKEIRKLLKDSTLKRYYRLNKSKVESIVQNLQNNSIEIGNGLEQLKEIKGQLEDCIAEQNAIEEEELKELTNVFPPKEAEILVKYINSKKFKDIVLK